MPEAWADRHVATVEMAARVGLPRSVELTRSRTLAQEEPEALRGLPLGMADPAGSEGMQHPREPGPEPLAGRVEMEVSAARWVRVGMVVPAGRLSPRERPREELASGPQAGMVGTVALVQQADSAAWEATPRPLGRLRPPSMVPTARTALPLASEGCNRRPFHRSVSPVPETWTQPRIRERVQPSHTGTPPEGNLRHRPFPLLRPSH